MNVMQRILIALLFLFLWFPFACKRDKGLTVFNSFPERAWSRFEKQSFDFRIADNSFPYDLMLILRHSENYPFGNLYVNVVTEMPGGEERIMEHDFKMKDSDGAFLSRVKEEGYREITFPLHTGLHFAEEGSCSVEIENLIPKIEIPGVLELGVILQRSSPE